MRLAPLLCNSKSMAVAHLRYLLGVSFLTLSLSTAAGFMLYAHGRGKSAREGGSRWEEQLWLCKPCAVALEWFFLS